MSRAKPVHPAPKPEVRDGNVVVRLDPRHGRDWVLVREFEDAGGKREFTLWLSRDELERLLDAADTALDHADGDWKTK